MGAHTVEIVTTACPWVPDSAKVLASGTWTIQTANGDKLSGTYYSYWNLVTLSSLGKIFITAGTGRFERATGEAVLVTQDNANLSGSDKGEGWIAY